MRRALLIGASGFLGRHIHQVLLADGWWVRPTSRTDTPGHVRVDLSPARLAALTAVLAEYGRTR